MSNPITLPNEIYARAERLAELMGKSVEVVVITILAAGLPPLNPINAPPISSLKDDEVLALRESQMAGKQAEHFSFLLDKQQAGTISASEDIELWELMAIYQERLLRKAQALRVAVERGLREPLS